MTTTTLISPEEYLLQEAQSDTKHEYHAGEIVNMAGAKLAHNRIVSNLIYCLSLCLDGKSCEVLANDMLLALPECEKYVYPDVMIVCEKPQLADVRRQGFNSYLEIQTNRDIRYFHCPF
jgi:Uma2 family endonuclease